MSKHNDPAKTRTADDGGQDQATEEDAGPMRRLWQNWIKPLVIVAAVLFPIRSSIADWNDVPTGSMNPNILVGDRIFVNKLAFNLKVPFTRITVFSWSQPGRGDIVTFWSPESGTRLVKRVVAVPGDEIEMTAGMLSINGEQAVYTDEPAMSSRIVVKTESIRGKQRTIQRTPRAIKVPSFRKQTVPDGHFWMMGDNRDNSRDSRFFSAVPEQLITGRAVGVAFSLDKDHWTFRWKRFFKSLY